MAEQVLPMLSLSPQKFSACFSNLDTTCVHVCRLSPTTWIIYALSASQLGDNQSTLTGFGGSRTQTVSQFMTSYFGYKTSFEW